MVSINQEQNKTEPRTVADVVCPFCFKPLLFPAIYAEPTRGGVKRRGYQGWCFKCNRGAIVLQQEIQHDDFKADPSPRWKIEKFKEVKQVYQEDPYWTIVDAPITETMPQTIPVILTGPGGDYNKAIMAEQVNTTLGQFDLLIAKIGGVLNLLYSAKTKIQNDQQHD